MIYILVLLNQDSLFNENIENPALTTFSIWFWIALIEFVFIGFLLFKLNKKDNKLDFDNITKDKKRNAKNYEVDMDNLMNSINGSKDLYKELSRTCHPDRFINSDKQKIAEEIFQNVSKNKRDFKKLTQLKERARIELNINFK